MSIFNILKQGQLYANTWPLNPKLGMIFPENRVIKATKFAQRFMPFVAVFAVLWQQYYSRSDIIALAAATLTSLFALLIPLQGLYWLGKRATTELPSQTELWFFKIYEELQQAQIAVPIIKGKPTYQAFAEVLFKADKHFGHDFWQNI